MKKYSCLTTKCVAGSICEASEEYSHSHTPECSCWTDTRRGRLGACLFPEGLECEPFWPIINGYLLLVNSYKLSSLFTLWALWQPWGLACAVVSLSRSHCSGSYGWLFSVSELKCLNLFFSLACSSQLVRYHNYLSVCVFLAPVQCQAHRGGLGHFQEEVDVEKAVPLCKGFFSWGPLPGF